MTPEIIFILAMPALLAVAIIWMIASGAAKTGSAGTGELNPYPERLDAMGRWFLAIFSALIYLSVALAVGPLAAAFVFAALLVIDFIGAFIWTCIQEVLGRRSVPFGIRLFRNTRDFYLNIVGGILQGV